LKKQFEQQKQAQPVASDSTNERDTPSTTVGGPGDLEQLRGLLAEASGQFRFYEKQDGQKFLLRPLRFGRPR
jgi:hypothetical protein